MTITISQIRSSIEQLQKNKDISNNAAVFIPIVNLPNEPLSLLFQIRSSNLSWQPGDICFPGGRMESKDTSPIQTAVRETNEELGIDTQNITIYGQLPAFISTIGLKIYPVVGELTSLKFNLNKKEVDNTFTVPIDWFASHKPTTATMEVAHKPANDFPFDLVPARSQNWQKRSEHKVSFYHYQDYVIWGLTAQIIQQFLNAIKQ